MKTLRILLLIAFSAYGFATTSRAGGPDPVHVYEIVEVSFTGALSYENPYMEVDLWVDLEGPGERKYRIPAFWDGGQIWRARLAATAPGLWSWSTSGETRDPGLDGKSGSFAAISWTGEEKAANINRRGFIRVSDNGHTLEYADGTPFFYTGDTRWTALTAVYAWHSDQGSSGISFQDALQIRKDQGFNGVNIISCFPTDLTKPIWHKRTQKKKLAEDGSTPFEIDVNAPDQALAANYLRINPGYWQQVDRKMKYMWDEGFAPFIETVRRSEAWPEENKEEQAAFTNFVRYLWARYGACNWIFSWLHWDWGPGRNEDYRPMIDEAYRVLGDMPYGQPKTAMAAGSEGGSHDTWGTGAKAPWLDLHNISNGARNAGMHVMLRQQYALPDPLPSINLEPFYPGWNNAPTEPLDTNEMAQFQMYASVLNGALGGHAWGDDYYAGNRNLNGDPHVNGFNRWKAASMGHLKDFILDGGHDYGRLAPTLSHLVDNQQEFLALAMYPDLTTGLGFISAKMKSSDIKDLLPKKEYTIQWWDIDSGGWKYESVIKTNKAGLLKMPPKPDQRGWAYRIKLPDRDDSLITLISTVPEEHKPVQHGLGKLAGAMETLGFQVSRRNKMPGEKSDFYILAGLSGETSLVTDLLKEGNQELPEGKEGLLVRKTIFQGKSALLLCGSDDVGLMYAALDVAKRISWSEGPRDPFAYVRDVAEKADVQERGVSTGTFQRRYFEERLYDTEYWEAYFDMMAESRLNQFMLIFGYKNNQYREPNFTAPVYPNFFNLEEYPLVHISGITAAEQQKNCEALRTVIGLAHERGIEFGVGLWDQIERDKRYTALVRTEGQPPADLPDNIIWGLTQENLIPYTKVAMRKFFRTFPDIDLVQFRMHWEAGITGEAALQFWKEIFGLLKDECPDIKVEARAKNVPDETLYDGVATGMDFRVTTKHWMEQMGMPFHPTHINRDNQHDRRHGYADLLRYPQRYGFKWRVWNGGTTRVLLWGDPDWARLFAEGSHLYNGAGYEFNEPLYFKMNGSRHDAAVTPILDPEYRYYTYEFERYWHFFQLLGYIGYNPETPSDTWEKEFQKRHGEETGIHLMQGLHLASKVLPRIVSASYLYSRFPSPQGWPELQRMQDLEYFAEESRPSDIQQFASPMEEAELILSGGTTPRRLPTQTSDWFRETARKILASVDLAQQSAGNTPGKETISTITDLKMLAYLAMYHAGRLKAAVYYNLYDKTGDLASFDHAIDWESRAVESYGRLVEAAGDVYNFQLDFGSNRDLFPGHWRNEHERLQKELDELRVTRMEAKDSEADPKLLARIRAFESRTVGSEDNDRDPPWAEIDRISSAKTGSSIKVTARVWDPSGVQSVVLRYRRVSQFEDYQSAPMIYDNATGSYQAFIPSEYTDGKYDVMYFIETTDSKGNGRMYPDMEMETPYVIVSLER